MATNDYEFITRWRVRGTAAEVYDLVVDAQGYLRWVAPGLQKELAARAAP
jgi:hypothetical protein